MTMTETIRTTCPRDCYDSCGISVERREGRVTRVVGDRNHPVSRGALCGKCALAYNGVFRDPSARLHRPLRRTGPKGSGHFEAVSWDEALRTVAAGLRRATVEAGAGAVLHTHYTGTCSLLAGEFPLRFFHRLGATEVEPDTICNNAGHAALRYLYGDSTLGFDPKSARDSRCIVVWGANPSHSAPHAHRHWLRESGARIIAIDPVRHETAKRAHLHLQPYPGSDAALAFTLLHAARRAGLLDRDYIERHTVGWEEMESVVEGCTPAWGEARTGVPAALIEEAAVAYARGPSLLWLGQGLQRQPRGGNAVRACALLPAATGNLGRPGAGFCYVNGPGPRRVDEDYVCAPHLRAASPASISHMDLTDHLAHPARARALVCWNMNIAASAPRQTPLREALAREDLFTVVVDLFQTDTADFADIVLPAASFLEFDDLLLPYFHLYLSAQVKAADPPGEALPNQEIFRRLAAAMGWTEPELFEPDRSIIDTVLERTGLGISFGDLKRQGTVDPFPHPLLQFANGRFPTPSGRIEIASDAARADGHPRCPEPHADARPAPGCLRLLSPAGKWRLNDSYGNEPNARRALGAAGVWLNPADADLLGIAPGDDIELRNDSGRLVLQARCTADVPRGVALAYKGRWPKLEPEKANLNILNPGLKTDMGESSSVHGVVVRLRPVRPRPGRVPPRSGHAPAT